MGMYKISHLCRESLRRTSSVGERINTSLATSTLENVSLYVVRSCGLSRCLQDWECSAH